MDSKQWDQNHGFKKMSPKQLVWAIKKSHEIIILFYLVIWFYYDIFSWKKIEKIMDRESWD